jgi:hypothetical protein
MIQTWYNEQNEAYQYPWMAYQHLLTIHLDDSNADSKADGKP